MSNEDVQTRISVLLVDDQRFIGAALGRLLGHEEDGITLHYCQHATEALARASEIRPSVILQDLVLPDIDGLTMVELFRADPATLNTPVIVLSANDDAETRAKATAAGACDYLVKLPKREELVACVRRHAADARAAYTGTTPTTAVEDALSLSVLDDLRAPDGELPEFALTLMDAFADEVNSQVAVLRKAHTDRDAALLKATLHSLKGSSLTMGAVPLASLCAGMEQRIATGSMDDLSPQLVTDLESELARVLAALATHRSRATTAQCGPNADTQAV
jgi:DNA-binding response OmpR family regulator